MDLHLRNKSTWKTHKIKRTKTNCFNNQQIKVADRNLHLSMENITLTYKAIMNPNWIHKIALWGCANKFNVAIF